MIDDRGSCAVALLLVKLYGTEASTQAALRADDLAEQGDLSSRREWLRVVKAIGELQREEPSEDETTQ